MFRMVNLVDNKRLGNLLVKLRCFSQEISVVSAVLINLVLSTWINKLHLNLRYRSLSSIEIKPKFMILIIVKVKACFKDITQLYFVGNNIFKPLSVKFCFAQDCNCFISMFWVVYLIICDATQKYDLMFICVIFKYLFDYKVLCKVDVVEDMFLYLIFIKHVQRI